MYARYKFRSEGDTAKIVGKLINALRYCHDRNIAVSTHGALFLCFQMVGPLSNGCLMCRRKGRSGCASIVVVVACFVANFYVLVSAWKCVPRGPTVIFMLFQFELQVFVFPRVLFCFVMGWSVCLVTPGCRKPHLARFPNVRLTFFGSAPGYQTREHLLRVRSRGC